MFPWQDLQNDHGLEGKAETNVRAAYFSVDAIYH
jgi:hypothetical protein